MYLFIIYLFIYIYLWFIYLYIYLFIRRKLMNFIDNMHLDGVKCSTIENAI